MKEKDDSPDPDKTCAGKCPTKQLHINLVIVKYTKITYKKTARIEHHHRQDIEIKLDLNLILSLIKFLFSLFLFRKTQSSDHADDPQMF